MSQQSSDTSGLLISRYKSVGNFIKLQLVKQTGEWSLKMMSTHPYTLKVIGETSAVQKRTLIEHPTLCNGIFGLDTNTLFCTLCVFVFNVS